MATSPTMLWRRFRGLPRWLQVSIWVGLTIVVLAAVAEDPDERQVEAGGDRSPPVMRRLDPEPSSTTMPPETTTTATTVPAGVPSSGFDTTVLRVVDGDTLEVAGGTRVRLIGVDAPETAGAGGVSACFGAEATRYVNELVPPGTPVRLVYDVERHDQFGRTLAYVYKLTDGVFVNQALAKNGFAQQLTVGANVAHAEVIRAAVAEARGANLGLWRSCQTTTTVPVPVTVPTTRAPVVGIVPTTLPTTTLTTTPSGGCHPSYAGACVPVGVSDVDCAGGGGNGPAYVSTKNFSVVGTDVYGLDSDNDGIACESS